MAPKSSYYSNICGKRRSNKGKGGRTGGGGSGGGGGGSSGGGGGIGGGGSGGSGGGSGGFGGGGGGSGGSGGSGSGGSGGGQTGALRGGSGGGQRQQQQQRRSETPSPQQLREWLFQRGASGGSVSCPYIIRTGDRAGQTCRKAHTQHRCFSRLDDAWRAEFGDEVERPHWAELLRSGVAIFDLDYDAILSAMYALSTSADGDCYRCVPPDPCIDTAALGASESVLPSTATAESLHTFRLDSGASCCFFPDSTNLTRHPAPVPVRLADPSWPGRCPFLHCPPVSGSFVRLAIRSSPPLVLYELGSSLYTLATKPPHVAVSAQVSASSQVSPPCSCCLLSHQTLLWHHCLGHPSLPRLRGMNSRLLVSNLPSSQPPLLPSAAPPCLPCVEGRQHAAPHSSSFPLTAAPMQTLHMDVWGPARVRGQGRERYFLLVVDNYTRYTTDFPLRSKGQVVDVLIPWIRAVRLQLRERFCQDLPILRLHSDRGGEFSSDLLRDSCHGREFSSSRAFVCDTSADKLSACAIPCVFLGFTPDAPGWQFYHPTSRRVFPSQDVTFDESVPFYRLFLYRFAPLQPPPLFLAPGPPPVDPLPPQGPAPSSVSQVDPLPGTAPVPVAVGSSAARGAASGCAASGGAELGVAESKGAGSGAAEPRGEEPGGAERVGVEPGGAEPTGVEPGGAELERAESGGAEPQGAASSGAGGAGGDGAGGAGVIAGAGGTGGTAATGPGGARTRGTGAARTGGIGGARAGDPTEPGAAGAGGSGAGGDGAGRAGAGGSGVGGVGAGGAGAGGPGEGGAGDGGAGAVDPGAGGAGAGSAGDPSAGGTARPRPSFVPLLHQDLGAPSSPTLPPPLRCPPPD
ncbi:unnamed protein product [Closterium sp. NIES-53]